MDLLRLSSAGLQYGTQVLLDNVDLSISRGQRLGLLGRNGEGKSTLLKVLAGAQALDSGERWLRPGTRIASLNQALPTEHGLSVFAFVAGGLEDTLNYPDSREKAVTLDIRTGKAYYKIIRKTLRSELPSPR